MYTLLYIQYIKKYNIANHVFLLLVGLAGGRCSTFTVTYALYLKSQIEYWQTHISMKE